MTWQWSPGVAPATTIGSGVGAYSLSKLSAKEEKHFCSEVESWIANGWLIKHDPSVHGEPAAVLPLLAVSQPHKSSTLVRPVLDYRALKALIKYNPGTESPFCEDTVRQWQKKGDTDNLEMLDILKVYSFQTVLWNNEVYVMTRMGFGLSIAPKMIDIIVKYCVRRATFKMWTITLMIRWCQRSNRLLWPRSCRTLACRPKIQSLRRLPVSWDCSCTRLVMVPPIGHAAMLKSVPAELTKRKTFSWCGKLVGHYPVSGWLRPFCSSLKSMTCLNGTDWDKPVSEDAALMCH